MNSIPNQSILKYFLFKLNYHINPWTGQEVFTYCILPQVATESLKEGTTGYIELTPAVPPKFLCNSLRSGVVHVEAVLKRTTSHDYSCKAQRRAIAQAVFSPVDDTKTACGSKMDAWNAGKAYRINVRPKDDRRREYRDYTRTVSLYVVKKSGTDVVCRERLTDVKVSLYLSVPID